MQKKHFRILLIVLVVLSATQCLYAEDKNYNAGKLSFEIEKKQRETSIGLNYSLRWEHLSMSGIGSNLKSFVFDKNKRWDITENTRFKFYGVKMDPWSVLVEKKNNTEVKTDGQNAANNAPVKNKKRVRLSLSPLINSVYENAPDDIRKMMLKEMTSFSPEWDSMNRYERRFIFYDILKLPVMGNDLPVLNQTRKLFEYVRGDEMDPYKVLNTTSAFILNNQQ